MSVLTMSLSEPLRTPPARIGMQRYPLRNHYYNGDLHDLLVASMCLLMMQGRDLLGHWLVDMIVDAARGRDPHDNVMQEGGPYHVRGKLASYSERLRKTERGHLADLLAEKYA